MAPRAVAAAPATAPPEGPRSSRETGLAFDEVAGRARAAREADRTEEALEWYRQGVEERPLWDEGWWYVGALSYAGGGDEEAAAGFERFLDLRPDSGPAWALLGLSEFRLGRYDAALQHLAKGLSLGSVGNAEIRDAVYHHMALLRIRASQFELAVEPLAVLARASAESPSLVSACGLLLLRRPLLPGDVPESDRELVQLSGRATCAALGQKEDAARLFEDLLTRFPATRSLHYGYGGYLLRQRRDGAADEALAQFRKEIEVDPASVFARLEIAFELMRRGDHAGALPYAREAVALAPGLFAAHNALGRALLGTGATTDGIAALEEAVRLAPESAEMRVALAQAYVQAGRREDAERERRAFQELQTERERTRLPGFAREDTVPPEGRH